ncbi:hypothetical protein Pve01_76540 [Planomonospora venezuelensis]|nr:hypothetical protein Pve01_76540 [Planomonospora venezuelensis]
MTQRLVRRPLAAAAVVASLALGGCAAGTSEPGAVATTGVTTAARDVADGSGVWDATQVHAVEVEVDEDAVAAMIETYQETDEKEWLEATVTIDGEVFERAGLRLKGNSSLRGVSDDADPTELPWLIRLDKFIDGNSISGWSEFIVRSNSSETALNEAVALDLLAEAGLASEHAVASSFSVNGADARLLRLVVQNLDEEWEAENFSSDGSLYKSEAEGDWSWRGDDPDSYTDVFDQETGDDDLTPLIDLLDFLNNSSDEDFVAELPERLDVQAFARYLAFEEVVDNFDDIDGPGNNSYLRWGAESGAFTVVAWDHNLAFGGPPGGGAGGPGGMGGFPGQDGERPERPEGMPTDMPTDLPEGERPEMGEGGPGRTGGSNVLVERFTAVEEWADLVEQAKADLTEELYASGYAEEVLDRWVAVLTEQAGDLVDAEDVVKDRLQAMEDAGKVVLSPEQETALAVDFAAAASPADPDDLERFAESSQRLAERLRTAVGDAEAEVRRVDDDLAQVFRLYKLQWDSPNLGATADSYPDYARILDEIRGEGLAARRSEWRRRLTEWSGQDLVPLVGAMAASVEEIEDRLEPINAILRRLEFGASGDRLRIRLRRLSPAHVQMFMKDLRTLSSGSTTELDEEALERRFAELSRFMQQLRRPSQLGDAATSLTDRDRLLDVRRHVEISAERYDHTTGELRATYRTLGEKSGGESQELVAFIVGSALRFRLGDEMRSRPRFAPVFLDEGFVKADSEFAGRAVQAWRGLGFQLIVGVPLDKVTGLEPHMDELLAITKNSTTHESWITPITDAGRLDGAPGAV